MILARPIVTAALAGIALTFGSAPGVLTRSPGPAADPHCTSAHYWVTNRGSMLLLDGHLDGGRGQVGALRTGASGSLRLPENRAHRRWRNGLLARARRAPDPHTSATAHALPDDHA